MSDDCGAVYIAIGERAQEEAKKSVASLQRFNDISVNILYAIEMLPKSPTTLNDDSQWSRWAKTNLNNLIEHWTYAIYIDADTRVRGSLMDGFNLLKDGWDMIITPSTNQGDDLMWHIDQEERDCTAKEIGCSKSLQLQGGLFFFRKCGRVDRLFECWREEWLRYQDQDQAALLRALHRAPVKIWLLGRPWNGGALVDHRFGALR